MFHCIKGKTVFKWWAQDKQGRIATCISISGKGKNTNDGEIIQGYSSKFWAYHLGCKAKFFSAMGLPYKELDKYSIGIEICHQTPVSEEKIKKLETDAPKQHIKFDGIIK